MEKVIIILGSQSANEKDRYLDRSEIVPVQAIVDDEIQKVPFFNSWGEFGVSSLAFDEVNNNFLYITTGNDLKRLDLLTGDILDIELDRLKDIHEITIIDGNLWLANTGYDEAICLSLPDFKVLSRIYIKDLNPNNKNIINKKENVESIDKFHCNQIFKSTTGECYALVHHVDGKQLFNRIAQKIIKSQGDGGVINLNTGERVHLKIKAPHSVRVVNNQYYVFDSGNAYLNIYDESWKLQSRLKTKGWGRGADFDEDSKTFFAGLSTIRKRYSDLLQGDSTVNGIQLIDTNSDVSAKTIELNCIEQVNNVYLFDKSKADLFINLKNQ